MPFAPHSVPMQNTVAENYTQTNSRVLHDTLRQKLEVLGLMHVDSQSWYERCEKVEEERIVCWKC